MQSLHESLIKEARNLKKETSIKSKWENDDSREELKNKYEDTCILQKHNKKLFDEVKRLKDEKKHCQNQEKERILDEETTKQLEEKIYKNIEESLNTDEVK
jgi:hypothetical protein